MYFVGRLEADRNDMKVKDAEMRLNAAQQQSRTESKRHGLELIHWQQKCTDAAQRVAEVEQRMSTEIARVKKEESERIEEILQKEKNSTEVEANLPTQRELEADLVRTNAEVAELRRVQEETFRRMSEEAEAWRVEKVELEQMLEQIESERTKDKVELEKMLTNGKVEPHVDTEKLEQVETALAEMKHLYQVSVDKVKQMEVQLAEASDIISKLKEEATRRDSASSADGDVEMKEDDTTKGELEEAKRVIAQLRADLEAVDFTKSVMASDTPDAASLDSVVEKLRQEVSRLKEEVKKVDDLREENAKIGAILAGREEDCKSSQSQVEQLSAEVEQKSEALKKAQEEATTLREEITELRAGIHSFYFLYPGIYL